MKFNYYLIPCCLSNNMIWYCKQWSHGNCCERYNYSRIRVCDLLPGFNHPTTQRLIIYYKLCITYNLLAISLTWTNINTISFLGSCWRTSVPLRVRDIRGSGRVVRPWLPIHCRDDSCMGPASAPTCWPRGSLETIVSVFRFLLMREEIGQKHVSLCYRITRLQMTREEVGRRSLCYTHRSPVNTRRDK